MLVPGVIALGHLVIAAAQAAICASLFVRYVTDTCQSGDPGPGGGFSLGVSGLVLTLVLIGVAGIANGSMHRALRARGAGPLSSLASCIVLSPVFVFVWRALMPTLARAYPSCH